MLFTEGKRKIILWVVTILLIGMAMLLPAFADELTTITKKGYTEYVYPHAGMEHTMGPEEAYYYILYYDGEGVSQYGEAVRIADDFVLMRVYPDDTSEEFTAPALTEEQIESFRKEYDPAAVKEEIEKEAKELAKKIDKEYSSLTKKGLIKQRKGNNYRIYLYTKANKEAFGHVSSIFSDVHYGNTMERPYDFSTKKVRDHIASTLEKANLTIPLQVSIVPFQCEEFAKGITQYRMVDGQEVLHILLFNSKYVSAEKQFDTQFTRYLDEAN